MKNEKKSSSFAFKCKNNNTKWSYLGTCTNLELSLKYIERFYFLKSDILHIFVT